MRSASHAAMASVSELIVSGSDVIHSDTLVPVLSPPTAENRTRSRSVRMPMQRLPSTTITEPTSRSRMRALT